MAYPLTQQTERGVEKGVEGATRRCFACGDLTG
jgi:hypothetical protein